jgi:hypothetical protein
MEFLRSYVPESGSRKKIFPRGKTVRAAFTPVGNYHQAAYMLPTTLRALSQSIAARYSRSSVVGMGRQFNAIQQYTSCYWLLEHLDNITESAGKSAWLLSKRGNTLKRQDFVHNIIGTVYNISLIIRFG